MIRNPVHIIVTVVNRGLNTLDTACCTAELVENCGLYCYALLLTTALSAALQMCIAIYCA